MPAAVREEARTASAWFRERARAWHAGDVEAGREDFIGLDDMGLLLRVSRVGKQGRGRNTRAPGAWEGT